MGGAQSLQTLSNSAQSLAFKPYSPSDPTFWNALWGSETTPAQLWGCLTSPLIVQIRDAQPANLACLLQKVMGKMAEIIFASKGTRAAIQPRHTFVNNFTYSVQNAVAKVEGMEDPVVVNTVSILLNCVRILTRVLSVLSEEPHSDWWNSYLWGGPLPAAAPAGTDPSLLHGTFHGLPMGRAILMMLLDLLFTEGFGVHVSLATPIINKESLRHNGVQLDKLWELEVSANTGFVVAGPPNLPNIRQWIQPSQGWSNYDTMRTEVLRCLLVCFSENTFLPPNTGMPKQAPALAPGGSSNHSPNQSSPAVASESPANAANVAKEFVNNRFLREFVSETGPCSRWTPTLCWSLLNVVLNFRPEGTALVQLPYNYALLQDNREPLVEIALHFLLLVLDFRHGEDLTNQPPVAQGVREKSLVVLNAPSGSRRNSASAVTGEAAATAASSSQEAKAAGGQAGPAATPPQGSASDAVTQSSSLPTGSATASASTSSGSTPPPAHGQSVAAGAQSNVFYAILMELSNGACLTSIYNNTCRLLLNALVADSTWMPQSLKKLHCFQELLILMWKLADENPHFVPHVLNSNPPKPNEACDILMLVTPLLYFVYESRNDESQLGLTYTAVFLLLKLSGDREFSVALNRTVPTPALAHIPLFSLLGMPNIIGGTYADALLVVAHKLVFSSPTHLDALLKVLLTLVTNIAPYLTRLSLYSTTKLLQLFELFTSPSFIYANATNHQYATMVLDVFNSIIQYQYIGHSPLVYSIIRRSKLFHDLGRLEPEDGSAPVTEEARPMPPGGHVALKRDLYASPKTSSVVTQTIEQASKDQPVPQRYAPAAHALAPASAAAPSATGGSSAPLSHASSPAAASSSVLSSSTAPAHSFVPTAQWKNSWKRMLPLEPCYRLLDFFAPKVDAVIATGSPTLIDESAILAMVKETTLVGVLPVPHPIVVRKYIPNVFTNLWFSSFIAGIIFLRQQAMSSLSYGIASGAPLWNPSAVKMFVVSSSQARHQQQQQQQQKEQGAAELKEQQQQRRPSQPEVQPQQNTEVPPAVPQQPADALPAMPQQPAEALPAAQ